MAIATTVSAFWILVANSFMQQSVGYVLRNGRAEIVDFFALLTSGHVWVQWPHTVSAALATATFFVVAISAYQLLRPGGGERQRLALARAFLKDAPILILDEPTAHLDARTEQELLRSLGPLMDRRITLMIAHRLVGMEGMDNSLLLDGGRIVEQGQHQDLLTLGGHYRRMWERHTGSVEER